MTRKAEQANLLVVIWPVIPIADLPVVTKRTLGNLAIKQLIRSASEIERFDMSIFNEPRQLLDFQDRLLSHLREQPRLLGTSCAAGQVLSLAYAEHEHLNFIPFTLSAQSLSTAL